MKRKVWLMMDSGAFSAWTRNKVIDVGDYIKFCHRHEEHLASIVNLDVIPGRPGMPRTQVQVADAAKQGWSNYRAMRKAGLNPMPVFHMGEGREWLQRMVDDGATYIGLGGVATATDKVRRPWLDGVFDYLCGLHGYPTMRVHGFGITAVVLIHRYPWFSTDSITWVSAGAMGDGVIPSSGPDGRPCYTRKPFKVGFAVGGSVTGKIHRGHLNGTHFNSLGQTTQRYVQRYLTEEGFDLATLKKSREARIALNARFFLRCSNAHTHQPYRKKGGIFATFDDTPNGHAVKPPNYRLIFSGANSSPDAAILTDEGCRYRLISYFNFIDGQPIDIPSYVETGLVLNKKAQKTRMERVRIV